ncbi:PEP-CTERM/exosortase system-associated acyltransferase [Chromatium okenii]|jgi:N-acyl amino acid synthase of PEP-CTERM/exosortase system|uniref:PEP-CTERM/exosortase system-associated acyltransferase n=1 Tax=Chromatium okenii TaxID=61644 RepID=UPI0026EF1968|nr:PEP-CTERM/exosortase system-associated acyltransferase [Chromatium okenii]MBV5310287.1 PEP-CTERM/exosortase system-associated acyltransferase [Chromatium okenii]
MSTSQLSDHFHNYFEIIPARTPDLLERIFRIRHDVYCREFGYLEGEACAGGLEHDDYDALAQHCLIVHRATGVGAGCVRMVMANNEPDFLLPLERFCGESLTDPVLHPAHLPRLNVAEGSRLAVHTQFRRRVGETESPVGIALNSDPSPNEQRTFPLLSLALFYASAAMMTFVQRQHVFVMIEPRLARRAITLKLPFVQTGNVVDYHGQRAPYYVSVQQVIDNVPEDMQGLYKFVHDSLNKT